MLEEAKKKDLKKFRGIYSKGGDDDVPSDHFVDAQNLVFDPGRVATRSGTAVRYTLAGGTERTCFAEFSNGAASPTIFSMDSNGNLYKDDNSTPIATAAGATSFAAVQYFNKLFICPRAGKVGVGSIYIYDKTTNTFRLAGGAAPTAANKIVAADGGGGGASEGPKSPGTMANESLGKTAWGTPNNAKVSDDIYSDNAVLQNDSTDRLNATNFGFAIPVDALIKGIVVEVESSALTFFNPPTDGLVTDYEVYLRRSGANVGGNFLSGYIWSTTDSYISHGSSTDLWGTTWTPAQINNSTFGVSLVVKEGNFGPQTAQVDHIRITVYYTPAAALGDIPAGIYRIAVCYETDTGFLTPPGPFITGTFSSTTYTAPGGTKIDLSVVPKGPSNIIARHILITHADGIEYFFVPDARGGLINNNIDTTTILNFFEVELIESADYLFNLRETIPAGAGVDIFSARLVVWGFTSPDESLLRLSRVADPESFDQTLESVIIQKDDGYTVVNTVKLRDILYICKDIGLFGTNDNGDAPVNWDVFTVDNAIGSTNLGISTVSPTVERGSHNDTTTIVHSSGYWLFNGVVQQPDLSWKISKLWGEISDFTLLNPFVDIKNKAIYIVGYNNGILVADYNEGNSPQLLKWCPFYFYGADGVTKKSIVCAAFLDASGGGNPVLCWMFSGDLNIYQFDSSETHDVGEGIINSDFTLGSINFGGISILKGIRVRVTGAGNLFSKVFGQDYVDGSSSNFENLRTLQLEDKPEKDLVAYSKFVAESFYLHFEVNELDAWFDISGVIDYGDILYSERPM